MDKLNEFIYKYKNFSYNFEFNSILFTMISLIKNKLFPPPLPVKKPEIKVIPCRFGIKITDNAKNTAIKIGGVIVGIATLGLGGFYGHNYLNQKNKLGSNLNSFIPASIDKAPSEITVPPLPNNTFEASLQDTNETSEPSLQDTNEISSIKSMLSVVGLIIFTISAYAYFYDKRNSSQNSGERGNLTSYPLRNLKPLPKGLLEALENASSTPAKPLISRPPDYIPPSPPPSALSNPKILNLARYEELEGVYKEFHDTEVKFNEYLCVRWGMCKFFTDEKIRSLANAVAKKWEHDECYRHLKSLFDEKKWVAIFHFSNDLIEIFKDFKKQSLAERQSNVNVYAESLINNLAKISEAMHAFSEINIAIERSIHFVDAFKAHLHPWKMLMNAFKSNNSHEAYKNLSCVSDAFVQTTQRLTRYGLFIERILKIVEKETFLDQSTKDRLKALHHQLDNVVLAVNEKKKNEDGLFENWKREKDLNIVDEASQLARAIGEAKEKKRCLVVKENNIQCNSKTKLGEKKISFKSTPIEIREKAKNLLTYAIKIAERLHGEKGIEDKVKLLNEALPLLSMIKQKSVVKKEEKRQEVSPTLTLK